MSEVKFQDFRAPNAFCHRIGNINDFNVTVEFPSISEWDDRVKLSVLDRLYDATINLIETARFYSPHVLEPAKRADSVSLTYNDDVFDFSIQCFSDRIVFRKRGVSMNRFHDWYVPAAQSFGRVVETVTDALSTALERNIVITRSNLLFTFVLHDFKNINTGEEVKNYEVMRSLITKMPDALGRITDLNAPATNMSRTDFGVSLWDDSLETERRLLGYSVEAPANNLYTGLWFNFRYGSETYIDPVSGDRERSNPSIVLDEYEWVYELLLDRFLGGFVQSVVGEDIQFSSTATYIS